MQHLFGRRASLSHRSLLPIGGAMKHVVSVPWTDEERTLLRQMWANGIGCTNLGRMLGRSKYSVRSEIETLNLGPRGNVAPPPKLPPAPRERPPQPLPRGARTRPPLPSEMQHD